MIIGDIVLICIPKKSNVANKRLNIFEFVLSINKNTKSVLVVVKHDIIGREHPGKIRHFPISSTVQTTKFLKIILYFMIFENHDRALADKVS